MEVYCLSRAVPSFRDTQFTSPKPLLAQAKKISYSAKKNRTNGRDRTKLQMMQSRIQCNRYFREEVVKAQYSGRGSVRYRRIPGIPDSNFNSAAVPATRATNTFLNDYDAISLAGILSRVFNNNDHFIVCKINPY